MSYRTACYTEFRLDVLAIRCPALVHLVIHIYQAYNQEYKHTIRLSYLFVKTGYTKFVLRKFRDSVAYTGVILLSDMTEIVGGDLEIVMMNKELALEKIARKEDVPKETVTYDQPGKMILAQGGEILHHVTPVQSQNVR